MYDPSSKINITPTFLLRGVDTHNVINEYINGKLLQRPIKNEIIKISTSNVDILPEYSKNTEDQIYSYTDKGNIKKLVGTTNHIIYNVSKSLSQNKLSSNIILPEGTKCMWCRYELDRTCIPIGIPIRVSKTDQQFTFYTDGMYCSFECCYADLKRNNRYPITYRDPLYMNSEHLLKYMYSVLHPNEKPLQDAPDWRILKENGGFLDRKDFVSKSHKFYRTYNVIISPCKIEYSFTR